MLIPILWYLRHTMNDVILFDHIKSMNSDLIWSGWVKLRNGNCL